MTGMNRWNTNLKRAMATMVGDEIVQGARKMNAAADLMALDGLDWETARARVGLSTEDATRLARFGMNASRSGRLLDMLFEHGLDYNGEKPWGTDRAAFDKFDGYVFPELNAWFQKDRDLFDSYTAAVNGETTNLIVEPKLASRPILNNRFMGKLVNQFQSFAYAWGTQTVPLAMQRPGYELAMYASLLVGIGGLQDAIHNSLSGRRSLSDTLDLWQRKPAGMIYGAVTRGGLFGWMARPLGLLEQTPWGVGKALGNDQISAMYSKPGPLVDQMGPFFSWANHGYSAVAQAIADKGFSDRTTRQLWNAAPFHNLWAIEGFNRAVEAMGYDTPIGPKPIPYHSGD
jgi:hypothetical protein